MSYPLKLSRSLSSLQVSDIDFPSRYPYNKAATIAISTVKEFGTDLKEVHFVLFSDDIYDVWVEKANELVGK
ncbi:hypothetical protein Ancab_033980 [Ancistrocladus abbreviatus]